MIDEPESVTWDAIVVGTGIGGATVGHALGNAGFKVLFCEKGRNYLSDGEACLGDYPEKYFRTVRLPEEQDRKLLSRAARCFETLHDLSGSEPRVHLPFIGCGAGGSSALYGMAMERFFPMDFHPKQQFDSAEDSSVPERWPISYGDLMSYYGQAEQLYRVKGTEDPLKEGEQAEIDSPPALSAANSELEVFFAKKGLNPYRLPMACDYQEGCLGCQGFLCDRNCKVDSARACLEPAVLNDGVEMIDECDVYRLEADAGRVTGVHCRWRGKNIKLSAGTVILAAGALQTPLLLLRSAPGGLANSSGLVGKNLMRHLIDLYAVFAKEKDRGGNIKEISFNDLYFEGGEKLGTVQSFGRLPEAPMLVESMEQEIKDGPLPWLAHGFKLAKPVMRPVLGELFSRSVILASIMEDLPYEDNRVEPVDTPAGVRPGLHYRVHESEVRRIGVFRRRMKEILTPYRFMLLKQAENNDRIAHVCGTCRFGEDPAASVLNPFNRAHDLANLYVVDSSFFPSSAGTNPSLTIAANALRVADHLIAEAR